ncbi:sensor histidine kinase [Photobacterium kasasachensis]|uniref:sensor histidine kinase n=1 Tax=Photobacterium kasasachensis TaxID=2910240 RepID=UPI003D13E397
MPSIKRDIYLFLCGLALVLATIYSLLMNQSYLMGMVETEKYVFMYEISLLEREYTSSGKLPVFQNAETFQVYTDLAQIPEKYRVQLDWENFAPDTIYEGYLYPTSEQSGQYLYAMMHPFSASEQTLYVVSQYDENILYNIFEEHNTSQSNNRLIGIVAGILVIIVFLIVRVLINRLTQPVFRLLSWAQTLNTEDPPKTQDLRYSEFGQLADQLSSSVKKQKEVVEREEFFLRAASHEMRTPVTIISASAEMLERIVQDAKPSVQRAIGRITRSSANMHSLITTLLWISRDNHHDLAIDNIDLHQMVDDVVQELDYLAGDKTIAISIEGITGQLLKDQVHELVRIVVVNLIRNAIQHSQQDTIKIKLSGSSLSIENTTTDTIDNTADVESTSFGVGLYLVEKICAKQHWHFETQPQADTFKVTVNFST